MNYFVSAITHQTKSTSQIKAKHCQSKSKGKIQFNGRSISGLKPKENSKNVYLDQCYGKVLNKLLRLGNIETFIREGSKYVNFKEDFVQNLKSNNESNRRSRKEIPELEKALWKDGGFLKHYCHLLEKSGLVSVKSIRRQFYQKFKSQLAIREDMFFKYFAKEKLEDQIIQSAKNKKGIFYQSEKKQKSAKKKCSSVKKIEAKINLEKNQVLSQIYDQKSQGQRSLIKSKKVQGFEDQSSEFTFNRSKSPKQKKSIKKVTFKKEKNDFSDEDKSEKNSVPSSKTIFSEDEKSIDKIPKLTTPKSKKNKKQKQETEEEKQLRYEGIISSKQKSNIYRKNKNVITFEEDIKKNLKLKEIYEQILKQKENKESNKPTEELIENPAIRRSSRRKLQCKPKLRNLKESDLKKLSEPVNQIIKYYNHIEQIGSKDSVEVISETKYLGTFEGIEILKAIVIDCHDFHKSEYNAIFLQQKAIISSQTKDKNRTNIEDLLISDWTIQAIILDQSL